MELELGLFQVTGAFSSPRYRSEASTGGISVGFRCWALGFNVHDARGSHGVKLGEIVRQLNSPL